VAASPVCPPGNIPLITKQMSRGKVIVNLVLMARCLPFTGNILELQDSLNEAAKSVPISP